jgi:integrase
VLDKFIAFAQSKSLDSWDRITTQTLQNYAAHLESQRYAYRTQYLELTTLKQAIHWLVKRGHLGSDPRIDLPLSKPQGTDTYCWQEHEVRAMLEHCRSRPDLQWLEQVILALATTGLRISELSSLRWADIDFKNRMIRLVDESRAGRLRGLSTREARTLKSGHDRSFPIQEELLRALNQLPRHGEDVVFHGPRGGRLKPDVVRRVLIRKVLKPLAGRFPTAEGEVGFADGRLHSFRHFFCSLCANRGVPQRVVMRWLGHKDSRMVEHYYHLHDEEARRQMGRIKLYDEEDGGTGAAG